MLKEREEKQQKYRELYGDPGEGFEWASDVDSDGKPIWGAEGEDYEFYYPEDKEAFEKGESTLPPLLNPRQIQASDLNEVENTKDRFNMLKSAKDKMGQNGVYRVKARRTGGGFKPL